MINIPWFCKMLTFVKSGCMVYKLSPSSLQLFYESEIISREDIWKYVHILYFLTHTLGENLLFPGKHHIVLGSTFVSCTSLECRSHPKQRETHASQRWPFISALCDSSSHSRLPWLLVATGMLFRPLFPFQERQNHCLYSPAGEIMQWLRYTKR